MKNRKQIPLILLYILLCTATYYYSDEYIVIGGFGFMYYYFYGGMIFVLGAASFLIKPNLERLKRVAVFGVILMLPYIITIFYSAIVWVSELSAVNIVTRGFFHPVYSMIGVIAAMASVYVFGDRGIGYHLTGLVLANGIKVFDQIQLYGWNAVYNDYMTLIRTFGDVTGKIAKEFEKYGYAYAFMIIALYFLIFPRKKILNWLGVFMCFFGFILGFKRSALLALLLALAAGWLIRLVPRKNRAGIMTGVAVLMVAAGQLLIVAIHSGLFREVMEFLHVNTMGRTTAYDAVRPYYDLSIGFLGRGLGFVNRMMSSGQIVAKLGTTYQILDIHNEFLRAYIEVGQIGFLTWLIMLFVVRIRSVIRRGNHKQWIMALCSIIFWFTLFFSENAYYAYYVVFPCSVVALGCGFDTDREEKAENGQ